MLLIGALSMDFHILQAHDSAAEQYYYCIDVLMRATRNSSTFTQTFTIFISVLACDLSSVHHRMGRRSSALTLHGRRSNQESALAARSLVHVGERQYTIFEEAPNSTNSRAVLRLKLFQVCISSKPTSPSFSRRFKLCSSSADKLTQLSSPRV